MQDLVPRRVPICIANPRLQKFPWDPESPHVSPYLCPLRRGEGLPAPCALAAACAASQGAAQAFPLPASPFQFHCPDDKGCKSSPLNPLLPRERGSRSSPVATRALWVRARAATHRTGLGQRGPLQFVGFQS